MKQRIFMYLFIFTVLVILFQYFHSKRLLEGLNTKVNAYDTQIGIYKDSIVAQQHSMLDLLHFNLENNEDALSYFETKGFQVDSLVPYIKDQLYALNEVPDEHPLIPYAASSGRKMMINSVKLLNHKWMIADFSDGEFWGELFLTYEITETQEVTFHVVESFLYPFN
ncbi:MAG: hydrolase [Flavobacteriales bacterium]|nr:hydrolase [Flavobacteriia bacterium]NCP60445.1 hydrolase [Flavobacteriales bacterium]PIV92850.1 MAG: hydrolase [Flavobacteriaceae bacterium CG17_big_fil_post_rev_8_21_14_2_50_33_15]PIY12906.1 MAG: hydrolase [Flavobacteriaceae bacterium CG_4_10_14_3_um_filter_33_47]PJB16826.1 MAG: hydrolase [Flavobacteriaceae bacterium CG_4_9_14_3_um_filter_33_16]